MSAHMKKRPTSNTQAVGKIIYCLSEHGRVLRIPLHVANKYLVTQRSLENKGRKAIKAAQADLGIDANAFFSEMDKKYTEAGALLRGTRHREGMSQIEFAKRIGVTQGDLSKMEKGSRSIGKSIAKRIEKEFGVNYRYFLG